MNTDSSSLVTPRLIISITGSGYVTGLLLYGPEIQLSSLHSLLLQINRPGTTFQEMVPVPVSVT